MEIKPILKKFGMKLLATAMGAWAFSMAWLFVSPLWKIVPWASARTVLAVGGAIVAALGTDAILGWRFGGHSDSEGTAANWEGPLAASKAQPKQAPHPGASAPGRYMHRLCGAAFDEPIVQTDFVTKKKEWVCPACWKSMGDVKDEPAPAPAQEPVLPPAPASAPAKEQTVIRLVIEGPATVKQEGPA